MSDKNESTCPPDSGLRAADCSALIPCPFCGFEDQEPESIDQAVSCPNCGARGPSDLDAYGLECERIIQNHQEAWNRRCDEKHRKDLLEARIVIEAGNAACKTLVADNERLRDEAAKAKNGECLLELTVGFMQQDLDTIRSIIEKGGTANDVLLFLDSPRMIDPPEEKCETCGGCGMIPSDDPNGDVMNTRCPKCNPPNANCPSAPR